MAIEFINIEKSFGDTKALSDICLRFEEGRIYGLLGRNGAGKSTLLNILTGRIFKDSGEVLIDPTKTGVGISRYYRTQMV